MICQFCGKTMNYVMHFEKNKRYGFNKCNKCQFTMHKKRLHLYDDTENQQLKIRKR